MYAKRGSDFRLALPLQDLDALVSDNYEERSEKQKTKRNQHQRTQLKDYLQNARKKPTALACGNGSANGNGNGIGINSNTGGGFGLQMAMPKLPPMPTMTMLAAGQLPNWPLPSLPVVSAQSPLTLSPAYLQSLQQAHSLQSLSSPHYQGSYATAGTAPGPVPATAPTAPYPYTSLVPFAAAAAAADIFYKNKSSSSPAGYPSLAIPTPLPPHVDQPLLYKGYHLGAHMLPTGGEQLACWPYAASCPHASTRAENSLQIEQQQQQQQQHGNPAAPLLPPSSCFPPSDLRSLHAYRACERILCATHSVPPRIPSTFLPQPF